MPQHRRGLGTSNSVPIEDFARQIQTVSSGVLCEVPQDVGQLQRAAQRFCDGMSGVAGIAEYMNREMTDRARNARAVEVQGRQIGGSEVFASVHLHAGKDLKKVFPAELIVPYRP